LLHVEAPDRGFDLVFVTQWPSKIHHQAQRLYSRYRSAALHTASHEFKVPRRVLQGLSVYITVIIFLWLGWLYLSKPRAAKDMKVEQGAGASLAASALAPLGAALHSG
jgi:hypothetical protein